MASARGSFGNSLRRTVRHLQRMRCLPALSGNKIESYARRDREKSTWVVVWRFGRRMLVGVDWIGGMEQNDEDSRAIITCSRCLPGTRSFCGSQAIRRSAVGRARNICGWEKSGANGVLHLRENTICRHWRERVDGWRDDLEN
ncbi:MAG: hypothetical protein IH585_21005 [Anaerolineaceae bacterium]|nr:hypothetical protein [Anaerolineaceae bacterium]